MSIRPTFKLLAAATLGLTAFGAAQAAPIITTWDYAVNGVWSDYAPSNGVTLTNSDRTLSWGNPSPVGGPQSSLVITDPAPGSVNTYVNGAGGTTGDGITITHNNFVITGNKYLTGATLTASLTLTPTAPPGATLTPPPINYNIDFKETPNEAGTCASTIGGPPCPDIFVLLNNETLQQDFTIDGITYTANIFAAAGNMLRDLTDAECTAAGAALGCRGFATMEERSTPLSFGFTISTVAQAVPEPGILALLGIGFAGVGFVNRRRRSSTAA